MTSRALLLTAALLMTLPASADEPNEKPEGQADPLAVFVTEFVVLTPGENGFPAELPKIGERSAVAFDKPFAVGKYEVPQNLYKQVMGNDPSRWKGPRNSAEMMTFAEAQAFCAKATTLLRARKLIKETETIRLPTEAEWEYAARAGTTTAYSFGDDARAPDDAGKQASILDAYCWHTGNAAGNDPPVGALKPNPWGLYDVHGYLREFCLPTPADNDKEPDNEPQTCVARGGSWVDTYDQCRSDSRAVQPIDARGPHVGFRCVKVSE